MSMQAGSPDTMHPDQSLQAVSASPGLQQSPAELFRHLQGHLLDLLTARELAAVRGTCLALRHLIDDALPETMQCAAASLLPPHFLEYDITSLKVQALLRQQASIASDVHSDHSTVTPIPSHPGAQVATLAWSPGFQSQCLAITIKVDNLGSYPDPDVPHSYLMPLDAVTLAPVEVSEGAGLVGLVQGSSWEVINAGWCGDSEHFLFGDGRALDARIDVNHGGESHRVMMCDVAARARITGELRVLETAGDQLAVSKHGERLLVQRGELVVAYELPGLSETCRISPPDVPLDAGTHRCKPSWLQCVPDGSHLAVAWSTADHLVWALGIYEAVGGRQLGLLDVRSSLNGATTTLEDQPQLAWSPTGRMLLASGHGERVGHSSGVFAIIQLDGSCQKLDLGEFNSSELAWSPCGRYIQVIWDVCVEPLQQGVHWIEGFIWDAENWQKVFTWQQD